MEKRKKLRKVLKRIGWACCCYFSILTITVPVLLTACERSLDLTLKEESQKLVVEATIENGAAPVVILSRSLDYFSTIKPEQLFSSFVQGADVFISNGVRTHKLKEYIQPISSGFGLRYYSIDSTNLSTAFLGELNKTYSLRILVSGKEYTATTTIPRITKVIDSLYSKAAPPQVDTLKAVIMVRATDPPGFGDYIRYFTKRNRAPFLPPINSAFDDLFVDGTTYELPLEPGVDRNRDLTDNDRYFSKGDTVVFKLSNIDKGTYDFWRTMEFSYQSIGNPFSTPTKVLSNIKGSEALGYFGGYASQFRTIIIRR